MIVLTSSREASDYGGRSPPARRPGSCLRTSCREPRCALPGGEPAVSRRLRAVLVGGAVAAATFNLVTFYVNGWPSRLARRST